MDTVSLTPPNLHPSLTTTPLIARNHSLLAKALLEALPPCLYRQLLLRVYAPTRPMSHNHSQPPPSWGPPHPHALPTMGHGAFVAPDGRAHTPALPFRAPARLSRSPLGSGGAKYEAPGHGGFGCRWYPVRYVQRAGARVGNRWDERKSDIWGW